MGGSTTFNTIEGALMSKDKDLVVGRVVPAKGAPVLTGLREGDKVQITERLGQGADGGGQRFNADKNRIELLPPEWIWALADVMTQGSKKYEPRNWEKGMDWSTMIGCIHRHLAKFQSGQRYDGKEFNRELGTTGCHELAMVAWNALALMSYDIRHIGNNDLPLIEQLDLFNDVNAATSNNNQQWWNDRITPPEPSSVGHSFTDSKETHHHGDKV